MSTRAVIITAVEAVRYLVHPSAAAVDFSHPKRWTAAVGELPAGALVFLPAAYLGGVLTGGAVMANGMPMICWFGVGAVSMDFSGTLFDGRLDTSKPVTVTLELVRDLRRGRGLLSAVAGRFSTTCVPAGERASSPDGELCYDVAVTMGIEPDLRDALARLGAGRSGLRLLVLHGSRGRGEAHAVSDWDLADEADAPFDPDGLLAALADRLKADRIDLVDLDRAGALLRHRVARDGVVIVERVPGRFEQFRLDAIRTWCDLAPVARAAVRSRTGEPPEVSPLDRAVLAERTLALERHLARVADRLPQSADGLVASTDALDAVILHCGRRRRS